VRVNQVAQSEAECLRYLGGIHGRQGRYDQALSCLRESMVVHRELGNPHGQAESLRELGRTLRAHGDHESARAHWREALAIFERLHTTAADEVRALLAEGA
jgi:tetratricopeptide (TPR) repeat protein